MCLLSTTFLAVCSMYVYACLTVFAFIKKTIENVSDSTFENSFDSKYHCIFECLQLFFNVHVQQCESLLVSLKHFYRVQIYFHLSVKVRFSSILDRKNVLLVAATLPRIKGEARRNNVKSLLIAECQARHSEDHPS